MTSWLGRGYDNVPGKPFGWAFHQERDQIRAHVLANANWSGTQPQLEARVTRIQERIHRNRPTYAQRHAAWLARQPRSLPAVVFTEEELTVIAERFAGANDPVGQSIAAKAARKQED